MYFKRYVFLLSVMWITSQPEMIPETTLITWSRPSPGRWNYNGTYRKGLALWQAVRNLWWSDLLLKVKGHRAGWIKK